MNELTRKDKRRQRWSKRKQARRKQKIRRRKRNFKNSPNNRQENFWDDDDFSLDSTDDIR